MLTDVSTTQLAWTAGSLILAYILTYASILPLLTGRSKYWDSQTWVGLKKQLFARYRGGIAALKNTRSMIAGGYEKYSRHGKPFVLPQLGSNPLVMISSGHMQELLHIPDDEVDAFTPNGDIISSKYTIGLKFAHGPHIDIVRRQLTRKLPTLTTDVYDELVLAMKNEWPASESNWTAVQAYPTCMKIVSRAANRVFAGTELCRTPEFLEASRQYAIAVFTCGAVLQLLPKLLHPIAAPVLLYPVKKYRNVCKRLAQPVIRKRIADLKSGKEGSQPNDALQWLLQDSMELAKSDPSEMDEEVVTRRLLVLNMVAIHTTSIVTTNVLLDLFSSPDREEYIAGLRNEVETVLAKHNGVFTKEAINSMIRVDSTIRESMRISTLSDLGMRRLVTAPNGIELSGGVKIPAGVCVAAPNHAIHTDPTFYPDRPGEWDAFRFSRPREEYLSRVEAGEDPGRLQKILEQKNSSLIATGTDWLSFGHGRHACPGRFFASQEMKLMLAHVVMTYDIKIEGERPANMQMNGSSVPTNNAEILVRLRKTC